MHSKLSHIDEQIVLARDTVIYVSDVSSHVSKPFTGVYIICHSIIFNNITRKRTVNVLVQTF